MGEGSDRDPERSSQLGIDWQPAPRQGVEGLITSLVFYGSSSLFVSLKHPDSRRSGIVAAQGASPRLHPTFNIVVLITAHS